jgi:hypothetical protein
MRRRKEGLKNPFSLPSWAFFVILALVALHSALGGFLLGAYLDAPRSLLQFVIAVARRISLGH